MDEALTKVQRGELHAHEAAARRFRTELSLYDGYCTVHESHSDAAHDPGHQHVCHMVCRRLCKVRASVLFYEMSICDAIHT